ncbi:MAG: dTDP-glucose 4,6-dehydratase [Oceanospirillaceae bacterium]|nr:dTDP-glucose 4,6-dehydratase [Oceanospirillaceae bacterium]
MESYSSLLVSGAAGFIGSNFARYWFGRHPESNVVVLDELTYAGSMANLQIVQDEPGFRFVQGNILDTPLVEKLLGEFGVDCIINFAAESHVDRSIIDPFLFYRTNAEGTLSLLSAALNVWGEEAEGKRFLQISTDEVYGSHSGEGAPFTESSPCWPGNPYSASKAAADSLVVAYHNTYGMDTVITRSSNNYGANQFPEKLIPKSIERILNDESIPVYGNGLHRRDWIYVDDHARGVELALHHGKSGHCYNLCAGQEISNIELVRELCRCISKVFESEPELVDLFPKAKRAAMGQAQHLIAFVADRPGHDLAYTMSMARAQEELGFEPQVSLADGLERTVRAYLHRAARLQQVDT